MTTCGNRARPPATASAAIAAALALAGVGPPTESFAGVRLTV
jgi:hypothetical protein